jgi:hypothetical protein
VQHVLGQITVVALSGRLEVLEPVGDVAGRRPPAQRLQARGTGRAQPAAAAQVAVGDDLAPEHARVGCELDAVGRRRGRREHDVVRIALTDLAQRPRDLLDCAGGAAAYRHEASP